MTEEGSRTMSPHLDADALRREFPALLQDVNGKRLVYLDSAASAQTPQCVLDAMNDYYRNDRANIHRGVHTLSQRATIAYDGVRAKVQGFINAPEERECLFVRGTTEGINLVAQAYGRSFLRPGDEIVISWLEHHSNIVPWQLLCEQTGAVLKVVPIDDDGDFMFDEYEALLSERTRIVSIAHVSNALGTILPVREIAAAAHAYGAVVMVDGAQGTPHMKVDVQELGCDFYTFSGHKVFGPTGVGALWGRADLLERMPPWQGGGDMIASVSFEGTTYAPLPHKFEAGTPHIAAVIGFGTALEYTSALGFDEIAAWEHELLRYATERFERDIPKARIIGTAKNKASVLSFYLDAVHPHDLGTILDQHGVAIRAGHHCAQPVMDRFGVPATARASFAFYNTKADVDALVAAVCAAEEMFAA